MPIPGKTLVLWMCACLLATLFLIDGGLRLAGLQLMVAQFERFGYGVGTMKMFGAAEVLTGLLLLSPATRLLAAGFALLLMALGVFAYVSTGVGFPAAPVTLSVLSLALIWMHLEQRMSSPGKP